MQMFEDKIEENGARVQQDTFTQNNPDNNGVLATKLQTAE